MTTEKILAESSRRPWYIHDEWPDDIIAVEGSLIVNAYGDYEARETIANAELVVLAVNSFEKQRECIREMAAALERAIKDELGDNWRNQCKAALARAKELLK